MIRMMWVIFFIITGLFSVKGDVVVSTSFEKPDFAYPKSVLKEAESVLLEARRMNNPEKIIQAAIQITISRNSISKDNADECIELLDSLSRNMEAPYRNIASLLEATLLQDIYSSQPWIYNNREISDNYEPESVSEWGRNTFIKNITEAVNRAAGDYEYNSGQPIRSISKLLTNTEDAIKADFSVEDFIDYEVLNLLLPFSDAGLSSLPFEQLNDEGIPEPTDLKNNIRNMALAIGSRNIESNNNRGNLEISSLMSEKLLGYYRGEELKKCNEEYMKFYLDTPWDASFIARYINAQESDKEIPTDYKIIKEYLKKFPDCRGGGELTNMVNEMEQKRISVSIDEQILPNEPIKGRLEGKNIENFHLLLVKLPESMLSKYIDESEVKNQGTVIQTIEIKGTSTVPGSFSKEFEFPGTIPGVYAVVASKSTEKKDIIWNYDKKGKIQTILISRLSVITGESAGEGTDKRLYVVSGINQEPVANAEVRFTPSYQQKGITTKILRTNNEGYVVIPRGGYNVKITSGSDLLSTYSGNIHNSVSTDKNKETLRGDILTDLGVYRPGDSVKFAAVLYTSRSNRLRQAPLREVKAILCNANGTRVDTVELKSDITGRVESEFLLPKEGLLGRWAIEIVDIAGNSCGVEGFEVAEYKMPNFYVELQEPEVLRGHEPEEGLMPTESYHILKFEGTAKTYAGLPVSDSKVEYRIEYLPYRLYGMSEASGFFTGEVKSDYAGKFTILLSDCKMLNTGYMKGRFRITASVTDKGGETEKSEPLYFSLGTDNWLSVEMPDKINCSLNDGKSAAILTIYNSAGAPIPGDVYYKVRKFSDGECIGSGETKSGNFDFDYSTLTSGKYIFEFSLGKEFGNETGSEIIKKEIILYRSGDKYPPIDTPLWIEENEIRVKKGESTVKIPVSSSYAQSWILAEISDAKESKYQWYKIDNGHITIETSAPGENERKRVVLSGTHNLQFKTTSITLIPEEQLKRPEIRIITFRDRITPGTEEEWTIELLYNSNVMKESPAMAVMSNKALNALVPFEWNFDPASNLYWYIPANLNPVYIGRTNWNMQISDYKQIGKKYPEFLFPNVNMYARSLYSGNDIRIRGRKYASSALATSMKAEKSASNGIIMEESVMADSAAVFNDANSAYGGTMQQDDSEGEVNTEELRNFREPLLFFMPMLNSDDKGLVNLRFRIPDYNGTWQLQLATYTDDMKGKVIKEDIIAAKRVIARLNPPRFARVGDKLQLTATLYNNSDITRSIGGRIILTDPVTGRIYADSVYKGEEIEPMQNRVITIDWDVPGDINMVTIKGYADSAGYSDGEQATINIYPSSIPLIESSTFYMAPGETGYKTTIPKTSGKCNITFSYNDNPIWEVLKSLPALVNNPGGNAISLTSALYGESVVVGLLNDYPEARKALEEMLNPRYAGDSIMVSNLEKNENLKLVSLNNTPWVNSAQSQTMRMLSLTDYLDESRGSEKIKEVTDKLMALQNKDGGWSWCDGMQSSEFITREVIHKLAMLKQMRYMPEVLLPNVIKAINYLDKEYIRQWKESGIKGFNYRTLTDYVLDRDILGIKEGAFSELEKKVVDRAASDWKEDDIWGKATDALLLSRKGKKKEPYNILESLSQYASESKDKGMWYDNLSSYNGGIGKLQTTSRVLTAYTEIEPNSANIDKLRQWLLLSFQTCDYGGTPAIAGVINAILTTGSKWTDSAKLPEIVIDGRKVSSDNISQITGNIVVTIENRTGEIEIKRDAGGPSWGGLIIQQEKEISEVKAVSVPELSISKTIYINGENLVNTPYNKNYYTPGDRAVITLTLKADKDMEYVCVEDFRGVCFEPVKQVSGYTSTDGIWYYKEVRDDRTNLFIPFLPKGTHVLTYECRIERGGAYSTGIAQAQSLYTPTITAHSAGEEINVR